MAIAADPFTVANRRAVFAVCRSFDLGRPERLDLATWLLDREVGSFNDLSPAEMSRIRDALEGATFVCRVQMERREQRRAARRPDAAMVGG